MPTSPIYDRAALIAAVDQGYRPDFLFFWGHTPKTPGVTGRECLSQWYPAAFVIDGITYPTAEHYMMAEKARLFGDQDACSRILQAPTPELAKKLGRGVRGFDVPTWARHQNEIVTRGNVAKFGQNPALRDFLRQTGERVLVEASPEDTIWGIGLKWDDPRAADPRQWLGLNQLGFCLMRARAELQ